jgi:hypothetical protein
MAKVTLFSLILDVVYRIEVYAMCLLILLNACLLVDRKQSTLKKKMSDFEWFLFPCSHHSFQICLPKYVASQDTIHDLLADMDMVHLPIS